MHASVVFLESPRRCTAEGALFARKQRILSRAFLYDTPLLVSSRVLS